MIGADNNFTYKAVIFAVAILFLTPTMISVLVDKETDSASALSDDLLAGYEKFTGTSKNVSEELWYLSGIYTPYGIGADGTQSYNYLYTSDGWLAGGRILSENPTQYQNTASAFSVAYDTNDHVYRYTGTTQDGHVAGDVYTSVTFDKAQQSEVFFTSGGKTSTDNGYYYDFTGWRFAWTPESDYYTVDANGTEHTVISTQTSLSCVWYNYLDIETGLSSQLTVSGSDGGIYYLSASDITREIGQNNMAKFKATFNNGVDINIYIKINPFYTSQGVSIEDCFNNGYWSMMVTSISTDITSYTSSQYTLNVENIWQTFVDLFTFNMDEYGLSPMMSTVASVTVSVCLYAILLSLGLTCWPILLVAGLVAAIQSFSIASIDWWPFN